MVVQDSPGLLVLPRFIFTPFTSPENRRAAERAAPDGKLDEVFCAIERLRTLIRATPSPHNP